MWFLVIFISKIFAYETLIGQCVRSPKNPLDMYPFEHLGLCISEAVPGFPIHSHEKCNKPLADIQSADMIHPRKWCTSEITDKKRAHLTFLLSKEYELLFKVGKSTGSAPLGSSNLTVYTHFNFVFVNASQLSLYKVIPSNPANVSSNVLSFSYEISFVSTPRVMQKVPVLMNFMIGCFVITVVFFVMVLFPNWFLNSGRSSIASIPRHAQLLVTLCGAGAGVISAAVSLVVLKTGGLGSIAITEAVSALVSSVVVSVLARVWGINDIALAMYCAPLIYPVVILGLVLYAQWMLVSVGSCASISLRMFVRYAMVVPIVKLPVSFLSSVLCSRALRNLVPEAKRVSVLILRFTRHRRTYLTYAHSCLFIMIFPVAHQIIQSTLSYVKFDEQAIIICAIALVTAVIGIGINSVSVRFEKDGDWGVFAFISTAGAVVVLWFVMYVWSFVVEGMSSTVQMTIYPVITAIVGIGFALAIGTISVISAVVWIKVRGRGLKNLAAA